MTTRSVIWMGLFERAKTDIPSRFMPLSEAVTSLLQLGQDRCACGGCDHRRRASGNYSVGRGDPPAAGGRAVFGCARQAFAYEPAWLMAIASLARTAAIAGSPSERPTTMRKSMMRKNPDGVINDFMTVVSAVNHELRLWPLFTACATLVWRNPVEGKRHWLSRKRRASRQRKWVVSLTAAIREHRARVHA